LLLFCFSQCFFMPTLVSSANRKGCGFVESARLYQAVMTRRPVS
jgi:hypothetical protein